MRAIPWFVGAVLGLGLVAGCATSSQVLGTRAAAGDDAALDALLARVPEFSNHDCERRPTDECEALLTAARIAPQVRSKLLARAQQRTSQWTSACRVLALAELEFTTEELLALACADPSHAAFSDFLDIVERQPAPTRFSVAGRLTEGFGRGLAGAVATVGAASTSGIRGAAVDAMLGVVDLLRGASLAMTVFAKWGYIAESDAEREGVCAAMRVTLLRAMVAKALSPSGPPSPEARLAEAARAGSALRGESFEPMQLPPRSLWVDYDDDRSSLARMASCLGARPCGPIAWPAYEDAVNALLPGEFADAELFELDLLLKKAGVLRSAPTP